MTIGAGTAVAGTAISLAAVLITAIKKKSNNKFVYKDICDERVNNIKFLIIAIDKKIDEQNNNVSEKMNLIIKMINGKK